MLAIYPLAQTTPSENEFATRLSFVSAGIRLLGQMLPGFATTWIDAYARAPGQFLFVASLIAALIIAGSRLGGVIESRMELVWRPVAEIASSSFASVWLRPVAAVIGLYLLIYSMLPANLHLPKFIDSWINDYITTTIKFMLAMILLSMLPAPVVLHLRKAKPYRAFIQNLKLRYLPAFFAVVFVATGLAFASHVAFNLEDTLGYVCKN
jgi:hypothetical protein